MKASQVSANPYRAAALIDELAEALEVLIKALERRSASPDRDLESAKVVLMRASKPKL